MYVIPEAGVLIFNIPIEMKNATNVSLFYESIIFERRPCAKETLLVHRYIGTYIGNWQCVLKFQ
jgi:hypothetical protein